MRTNVLSMMDFIQMVFGPVYNSAIALFISYYNVKLKFVQLKSYQIVEFATFGVFLIGFFSPSSVCVCVCREVNGNQLVKKKNHFKKNIQKSTKFKNFSNSFRSVLIFFKLFFLRSLLRWHLMAMVILECDAFKIVNAIKVAVNKTTINAKHLFEKN